MIANTYLTYFMMALMVASDDHKKGTGRGTTGSSWSIQPLGTCSLVLDGRSGHVITMTSYLMIHMIYSDVLNIMLLECNRKLHNYNYSCHQTCQHNCNSYLFYIIGHQGGRGSKWGARLMGYKQISGRAQKGV